MNVDRIVKRLHNHTERTGQDDDKNGRVNEIYDVQQNIYNLKSENDTQYDRVNKYENEIQMN